MVANIKVTEAGRSWSSGVADVDGKSIRWEAYRKNAREIRVMIAVGNRWTSPGAMGSERQVISPIARKAML